VPAFNPPLRQWQKEVGLGAFSALIGRPIVEVRRWCEAEKIPSRKTLHLGRWRIDAGYARQVVQGRQALPDGSHFAPEVRP
jgi:hypothetical protein